MYRVKGRFSRMVGSVLVASTLLLAACGSSPAKSTNTSASGVGLKHVDWANITDAGSLQVAIQNGIVFAGHKLGVKVSLYNNNASPTTALENAHLMTLNSPQVIADFNISQTTNATLGHIFNAAKIPCVGVDIQMPGCVWFQLNNPGAGSTMGPVVASIVKKKGWSGANTTVIGLTTWSTGPFVNGIVTDFYQSFAASMPGMVQKAASSFGPSTTKIGSNYIGIDCGLIPGPCRTAVSEALATVPSSRHLVFIGLNDQVVHAGLEAADAAGRTANAVGAGLGDGNSIARLRSDPQWVAEDDIFYHGWGEYLMAVATGLLKGVHPVNNIAEIPSLVITKAQVDKYYGKTGTSAVLLPPVPSQDKYLIPLGVLQKFHNIDGLQG
ncbi:MAG: hypothetical protein ACYCWN_02835 [Ferrimicrobium sp.]